MSAAERQRARLEALLERVRDIEPRRRRAKAVSRASDLIECMLRCSCGACTATLLPGDAPARQALAEVGCPACGKRGDMRLSSFPAIARKTEGGLSN